MWGPISDVIPSTPVFDMFPLGFVSLSHYLTKQGFNVRIINVAHKMLSNPRYDAEREIKKLKVSTFGIDLHWLRTGPDSEKTSSPNSGDLRGAIVDLLS
jgi:radical SAM superfamily enzyme YgiQ (UPF0313 family)